MHTLLIQGCMSEDAAALPDAFEITLSPKIYLKHVEIIKADVFSAACI